MVGERGTGIEGGESQTFAGRVVNTAQKEDVPDPLASSTSNVSTSAVSCLTVLVALFDASQFETETVRVPAEDTTEFDPVNVNCQKQKLQNRVKCNATKNFHTHFKDTYST